MARPKDDEKAPDADPLEPFEQALRVRVPSREMLLVEAKAQTARQRRRKQVQGAGLSALLLASTLWLLDPTWHSEDIYTAVGRHQQLALPDGSLIELNSATHLRLEQRLRSRQVALLQGEATFTVAHAARPFTVHSQGVAIRDIGTVFNVRSDGRGVAVAVVEGAVQVSTPHSATQRLESGEQLLAHDSRLGPVEEVAPEHIVAWQRGKLRFDGTPLRDVIADIQRYRQATIRLAEPRLGGLRISGEFDTAAVDSLIDLLPTILPVTLSRADNGSVTIIAR